MGLFERIVGTVSSFLQIGGPNGPRWKNNAGSLDARDSTDAAYVNVRGATPAIAADLVTKSYVDGGIVTATFTASIANALATMQGAGQLPSTGIIPVRVEGYGGGGGAPGNQGGSPTAAGGGGGAQYQSGLIYIDLSHTFNVTIGAGGLGSIGTPNGSGLSPNDGVAGGVTNFTDTTSGGAMWVALGANGAAAVGSSTGFSGQPGGSYALATVTITQQVPNAAQSGAAFPLHYLPGSGGHGGANAGIPGSQGSPAMQSLGLGGPWLGGTGGINGGAGVNTDGHGGGGGAAGPGGNGGIGGNGTPVGSNLPGGNGTNAAPNSGAGGGAGAGGPNGGTQNGSNGGSGGSGWMRATFFVRALIVS